MAQKLRGQEQALSGTPQPGFIGYKPKPILALRDPTTEDTGFPLGQDWVNKSTGHTFTLGKIAAGSASWGQTSSGSTNVISSVITDSGTATPSSDAVTLAGGSNISTSASGSTITVDLDATVSGLTSVSSTSFETSSATSGLTISSNNIDADGSNSNINITVTPKGTGSFICDNGNISTTGGNLTTQRALSGDFNQIVCYNSSNTANSGALIQSQVGGPSAGDAIYTALVDSGGSWAWGLDNSTTNDDFVLSHSVALGVSDVFTIDGSSLLLTYSGGAATFSGGAFSVTGGNATVSRTATGSEVLLSVVNGASSGTSDARVLIETGNLANDAYAHFSITGTRHYTMGIDQSDTNAFVISDGSALGTGNLLHINSSTLEMTVYHAFTVNDDNLTVTNGDIETATAGKGLILGSGAKVVDGTGDPNGSVTAPQGSLYLRLDGSSSSTRAYINTNGATAWTNITTAA